MYIRDFLDFGKICRVCGSTGTKRILVSLYTVMSEGIPITEAEVKNDELVFKIDMPLREAFLLYTLSIDEHRADRKIFNPKNFDMLYANNFKFTLSCTECELYQLESSMVTFHPLGSLTSNIYPDSEKITIEDNDSIFIVKNLISADRVLINYSCNDNCGLIDLPFIKMKNLPVKNKSKMLRKLRTLMLLS